MKRLKHQKNTRRFGAAILAATLITTCLLAGTLLKYVATMGSADNSRVAKFGVTGALGDLFDLYHPTYTLTNGTPTDLENPTYGEHTINKTTKTCWGFTTPCPKEHVVTGTIAPGTCGVKRICKLPKIKEAIEDGCEVSCEINITTAQITIPYIPDVVTPTSNQKILPLYARVGVANSEAEGATIEWATEGWIGGTVNDSICAIDLKTSIESLITAKKEGFFLAEFIWQFPNGATTTPTYAGDPKLGITSGGNWTAAEVAARDIIDTAFGNLAYTKSTEEPPTLPITVDIQGTIEQVHTTT